jgi:tetratricopeptide (TPR) repeat protein
MPKRRTVWDYNEMAVFFYSRGAYDLAISELRRALRSALSPSAVLHVNLGAAYLGKKAYAEAEASLRRGLAIDSRSQIGHALLGRLLRETGRERDAIAAFERARALDPDSPEGRSADAAIHRLKAREPWPTL